jgi:hypothetical protein
LERNRHDRREVKRKMRQEGVVEKRCMQERGKIETRKEAILQLVS